MSALSPHLLDRDDAVLVVVDVQDRLARAMPHRDDVAGAIVLLVQVAGALDVPVIVTRQNPDGLGNIVADVQSALPAGVARVDKHAFCCCAEKAFLPALDATGRSQVVLAGMEAHICVVQTALALLASGASVHVVRDAVCSRRDADRDGALGRLQAAGAEITSAESVAYELVERAGTEEFRAVLHFVKERDARP